MILSGDQVQLKRELVTWKIGQKIQTEPWRDKKMYEYTVEERERRLDEVRRFKIQVVRATEVQGTA